MSIVPELSVVIPFRDEAESLAALYEELTAALHGIPLPSEILFVDDESRDGGAQIVLDLAAGDRRVRLLSLSPHAGQSGALEAGFRAARGRLIATLDADGQNDPADLPRLLAALEGADCVGGVRTRRDDPLTRRLASRVANAIRRIVLGDATRDIGCSLRVMRAEFVARIKLFRGGHRFLPVLLEMEGARVVELPVAHRPRRFGHSKYDLRRRLGAVWLDLLAVYWLRHRIDRYEVKELSPRA